MCHFALLFGIPIDKEEYFSRIETSDYLRKYRSNPAQNWETSYNKFVASPFRSLVCQAKTMTWDVRTGATVEDLKEVSKTAKVIVLVSHWKGYDFSNDDLIHPIDNTKFVEAAAQANVPLAQWLAQALERQRTSRDSGRLRILVGWLNSIKALWELDKTIRDILEEALNVTIENELPLPEGISEYVESDLTRRTRRRNLMDNLFSSLIAPGNRLELFDGLYDCKTISDSIHGNFKGVLDLTTCTSTVLADQLSLSHSYRFRVVQFSKNQEPTWAAAALNITLGLMSQGHGYLDARQQAIQLVRNVAENKIAKGNR